MMKQELQKIGINCTKIHAILDQNDFSYNITITQRIFTIKSRRTLRSDSLSLLEVHRKYKVRSGDRSFPFVSGTLWNSLFFPLQIKIEYSFFPFLQKSAYEYVFYMEQALYKSNFTLHYSRFSNNLFQYMYYDRCLSTSEITI